MISTQFFNQVSFELLSLLFVTFVKGSLLYFIVYCTTRMVKSIPSELKHLLWLLSVLSFILIPFFSFVMPDLPVTTLRVHEEHGKAYQTVASLLSPQETITDAADRITASASIASRTDNQTAHTSARWHFWAMLLWLAGVAISSYRIIKGKMALFHLVEDLQYIRDRRFNLMLKTLSETMGIHHKIMCARGPRCRVPFAFKILKPTIVLPLDSGRWSKSKIHAVLVHELAHIKRKDNLTQFIARMICSLFWFAPFIWIAYSNIYLEQEETCDAFVIHGGTKPTEYARFMVHFARHVSEHALLAGIFISKGRVKMLEKRITNVLYPRRVNKILKGGKKMMTRAFMISAVLLLSVLVFPISYAKDREFYASSSNEEIFGTWVNTGYSGDQGWPQKIVYYPWGYVELYMRVENKNPVWPATSTLVDKLNDAERNIWYRDYYRDQYGGAFYQLYKISNNGTILEVIGRKREFPTDAEMNANGPNYYIYYRQ